MGRIGETRPPDVPAGARDEGLAAVARRPTASRACPPTRASTTRTTATTRRASCATSPRSTIEPAITHGLADHVGSLRPGRLADIVLWKPGVLRRQARVGVQGRLPGLGPARRGQRDASSARSRRATGRTGAASRRRRRRVSASRSSRRPAARRVAVRRRATRDAPRALRARSAGSAGSPATSLARQPRDRRRSRSTPTDGRVTLDGRPLAVDPVDEVPLSRRYLLR